MLQRWVAPVVSVTPDLLRNGYQIATFAVRGRVEGFARAVWAGSPAMRDADVERLIARLVPVVQSGQLQVANLSNQYIAQMAKLAGVQWAAPVDKASILNYRQVPVAEVYRRPAVTTYTALSKGATYPDALSQGLDRLLSIVGTDLQQAKNRQTARSIEGSGFSGFRRVLTGRENCALCAIASTQRYHRGDLMPIHPSCDCGVEPFKQRFNAQIIDPDLLDTVYEQIDAHVGPGASGKPLSDFTDLIITHDHGELGPTLAWRSDKFTSEADIAALSV